VFVATGAAWRADNTRCDIGRWRRGGGHRAGGRCGPAAVSSPDVRVLEGRLRFVEGWRVDTCRPAGRWSAWKSSSPGNGGRSPCCVRTAGERSPTATRSPRSAPRHTVSGRSYRTRSAIPSRQAQADQGSSISPAKSRRAVKQRGVTWSSLRRSAASPLERLGLHRPRKT
jgi:hypothetical protein